MEQISPWQHMPKPIWYIAAGLVFIMVVFLMCNKDFFLKITGNGDTGTNKPKVVNLKAQVLINGKPAVNYPVKLQEHTDSDSKTDSEGKLSFIGIPYDQSAQKVIHIQIMCNGSYEEIERCDLSNISRYPVSGDWIDLGALDAGRSTCIKRFTSSQSPAPSTITPPRKSAGRKEVYVFYSEANLGFKFTKATLNGAPYIIDALMTISTLAHEGDVFIFTKTDGSTHKEIVAQ